LLYLVIRDAERLGASRMYLEVRPSNAPALRLYHRTGYVQIGRRRDYYPDVDGREDALVLALDLPWSSTR
jgi:ribosomal-protein-alanine N-acetyltransferase